MKNLVSLFTLFLIVNIFALPFFAATGYGVNCFSGPVFRDEFNENSLDTTKWSTDYPSGNGGEQQYYASDAFQIKDGILNIYAKKKTSHGYPYTSGIITTQQSFAQEYGYFIIRAKLPKGRGLWPAFWLLPVSRNYPVEVDVFELLGHDPFTIHMTNHWQGQDNTHRKSKFVYTSDSDFSTDFHTFSIGWNENELKWYVDGVLQYKVEQGVPSEPLFMLINLAVGGNWPGNPDQTTPFPSIMQIDYVRVYKPGCYPFGAAKKNPDFLELCC